MLAPPLFWNCSNLKSWVPAVSWMDVEVWGLSHWSTHQLKTWTPSTHIRKPLSPVAVKV